MFNSIIALWTFYYKVDVSGVYDVRAHAFLIEMHYYKTSAKQFARLCDGMGRCNWKRKRKRDKKIRAKMKWKKLFQLNKNANTPKKTHGILNKTTFAFYLIDLYWHFTPRYTIFTLFGCKFICYIQALYHFSLWGTGVRNSCIKYIFYQKTAHDMFSKHGSSWIVLQAIHMFIRWQMNHVEKWFRLPSFLSIIHFFFTYFCRNFFFFFHRLLTAKVGAHDKNVKNTSKVKFNILNLIEISSRK